MSSYQPKKIVVRVVSTFEMAKYSAARSRHHQDLRDICFVLFVGDPLGEPGEVTSNFIRCREVQSSKFPKIFESMEEASVSMKKESQSNHITSGTHMQFATTPKSGTRPSNAQTHTKDQHSDTGHNH